MVWVSIALVSEMVDSPFGSHRDFVVVVVVVVGNNYFDVTPITIIIVIRFIGKGRFQTIPIQCDFNHFVHRRSKCVISIHPFPIVVVVVREWR